MGISQYLDETAERAETELSTPVRVDAAVAFPTPGSLALETPVWKKIENAVVVATDLKGSTKISYSKQDQVGARVYQASSGNCARIFQRFDAQFVDIQGDGVFGIFYGDSAVERAIACAFTLKSFSSRYLARLIDKHLGTNVPEGFETGLKVGADAGTILAKRIGVRGEHNEPVWAGKPVNYATKCAQAADRHEIVVTDRLYDLVKDNDFIVYSCGCQYARNDDEVVRTGDIVPAPLWRAVTVESLGAHSSCKSFPGPSAWCDVHGDAFCSSIESGLTDRPEVEDTDPPALRDDAPEARAA